MGEYMDKVHADGLGYGFEFLMWIADSNMYIS
jgi:hypothetical protein